VTAAVALAALVLTAPPTWSASTPPTAFQHWRYFSRVESARVISPSLVRIELPLAVYGRARSDLADLRVVDETGEEIPFAVDQPTTQSAIVWQPTTLSETGYVAGRYTQAVADAGTEGSTHDELEIDTSADEFSAWVQVEASDDEQTWRIVRDRAPIFRFTEEGFTGSLTVPFAPTRSRWLRVRVSGGDRRIDIDACSVANEVNTPPTSTVMATKLQTTAEAHQHQTWLARDFGLPNIPVSTMRFTVRQPEFYRNVEILTRNDGAPWEVVGQGDIYRDPQAGTSLSIDFPENVGRYWRVEVFDRSDLPLAGIAVDLLDTPRFLSFKTQPGHVYSLLYGDAQAVAPQYDFASITTVDERARATIVALGRPDALPPPPPPPIPWTESHQVILWIALVAAVGVIVVLAARAMR